MLANFPFIGWTIPLSGSQQNLQKPQEKYSPMEGSSKDSSIGLGDTL
jgi:hypothetical protein